MNKGDPAAPSELHDMTHQQIIDYCLQKPGANLDWLFQLDAVAFWARVDKEWIDSAVYAILAEEYHDRLH